MLGDPLSQRSRRRPGRAAPAIPRTAFRKSWSNRVRGFRWARDSTVEAPRSSNPRPPG